MKHLISYVSARFAMAAPRCFCIAVIVAQMLASALTAESAYSMNINIQTTTTPRGIPLWYVQDKTLPFVVISADFLTGSNEDPKSLPGATYFLADMLDEGAGDLESDEFKKRMRETFARFSVDAGRDVFSLNIRTLVAKQAEVLDLVKLAINEPRFDPEPLEIVRNQHISIIRDERQDPNYIASRLWASNVYSKETHPYALPSKGTIESNENISELSLRAQLKKVLVRDKLRLSVVGDIDLDTLPKLLDSVFADLPVSSESESEWKEIDKPQWKSSSDLVIAEFPNPQSVVMAGMPSLGPDHPDFFPLFVANSILGNSGFSARLMQEVREKRGLAYGVSSYISQRRHADTLLIHAQTRNDRVSETIQVIRNELAKIAKDGVSEDELHKTIAYLTGSYVLRFDSNRKIANQISGLQSTNRDASYIKTRNERIAAVTRADILRVAKRWLDPVNLRFVVVGSPEGEDDSPRVDYKTIDGL